MARGFLKILFTNKLKIMFGLFKKDPIKVLEKEYDAILLKARDTQRAGDIKGYGPKRFLGITL